MTDVLVPEWTFGERLRKARSIAGVPMSAVAERTGATERAVRSWETQANQPRQLFAVVDAYADLTGVDRAWLLTGEVRTGSFTPVAMAA